MTVRRGTFDATAERLAPGATQRWQFSLPPPDRPGGYAALVHVRWTDPDGRRDATRAAAVLRTPGAPPSVVDATLAIGAPSAVNNATLTLTNRVDRPLAGRVVFVVPPALSTEPESQPLELPPGGARTVRASLESPAARPGGAYPVFALFEYTADGVPDVTLATATLVASAEGAAGRQPRLVVGAVALLVMLALLAVAVRRSARAR